MTYIGTVLYGFTSWWEIFCHCIRWNGFPIWCDVSEGVMEWVKRCKNADYQIGGMPTGKRGVFELVMHFFSAFDLNPFVLEESEISSPVKEWRKTEWPSKSISKRFSTGLALSIFFIRAMCVCVWCEIDTSVCLHQNVFYACHRDRQLHPKGSMVFLCGRQVQNEMFSSKM